MTRRAIIYDSHSLSARQLAQSALLYLLYLMKTPQH